MTYSPNFRGDAARGASRQLQTNYPSGSLTTINKGTPVSVNAFSQVVPTDVSDESSVGAIVGLAYANLPSAATGGIVNGGRLENLTTSFALGDPVYVAKGGGLTNNRPSVGVDSFVSGDFVIFLGVVVKNEFNPAQKDIQLMIEIVGQL